MTSRPTFRFGFAPLLPPTLVLIVAAGIGGCGEKPPHAPDDSRVSGLVMGLHEASGSATSFQHIFAEGAAPKETERLEYTKHHYDVKSRNISGDSATLTVNIRDAATGSPEGEKEWTAVKVNDNWKLKEAPLPQEATGTQKNDSASPR